MAYLNANIPVTYAQIRREYLYDLKKHHGEVEDCIIFGMASITGRAILFHAIMENGAVFYRLPISAFIQRGFRSEDVPKHRLDELQLWNSFSYYPAVTCYDILDGLPQDISYIIRQRYMENMTMKEIGSANGYSRETARRKLLKAVKICREKNKIQI